MTVTIITQRGRVGAEKMCVKRTYAEPIYDLTTERSDVEVHCPNNFRLLRKGKHEDDMDEYEDVEDTGEAWQGPTSQKARKRKKNRASSGVDKKRGSRKMTERKAQPQCVSHNVVPPSSKGSCFSHFHWSVKVGGCLMLEAKDPKLQCPRPDPKVGIGRGDWDTPEFVYDAASNQCIASSSPALYPRCPPGWALEGLFKPYCYRKIYTPIIYDCDNAEGFKFM